MIINLINYFGRKAPLKSWRAQKNYNSWKSEIQIKVSFDLFFMDLCTQILDCLYFKQDIYLTSPEILRLLAAASKSSIGSEIQTKRLFKSMFLLKFNLIWCKNKSNCIFFQISNFNIKTSKKS